MDNEVMPAGAVVVGVDASPAADRALDWAVDQAVRERRPLTLVHAVDPVRAARLDAATELHAVQDALHDDGVAIVDRARTHVAELAPDLVVHGVVWPADPRVALLEASRQAALVVVGSRGHGPVASLLLGSVGVAVADRAECPVAVVRPTRRGVVRHGVLVGADGSSRTPGTVELAYRYASLRRLPLTIQHSYGGPVTEEEARCALAESVGGLAEKFPEVRARTQVVCGPADVDLVRASHRMDLVVVGAHHGGRLSRVLPGSVAHAVLEHATCPVLVVPDASDSRDVP